MNYILAISVSPLFLLIVRLIIVIFLNEQVGQTEPYKTIHLMRIFATELEMIPDIFTKYDEMFDNYKCHLTRFLLTSLLYFVLNVRFAKRSRAYIICKISTSYVVPVYKLYLGVFLYRRLENTDPITTIIY